MRRRTATLAATGLATLLGSATACDRGQAPDAAAASPPAPEAADSPPAPSAAPARDVAPSDIKRDEVAMFLPTFATRDGDTWRLPIEAWVFEPEGDGVVRGAALAISKQLAKSGLDDASAERLVASLRPFIVDNEGGKHVVVRWGAQVGEVCETQSDGRCSGEVPLAADIARTLAPSEAGRVAVVPFAAVLRDGDARRFEGEVFLLEDAGFSVISDIDDTIKVTGCHDKAALLANTLLRPFVAAAGVPALYRRWAAEGAAFHYVSNSPLPLLGALMRFIDDVGLPRGSLQLKPFRFKDGTFLDLLAAPEDHKQAVLESLVSRFSSRRFVLVGDTGERDPEIYAALARKFPERIAKIYLRDPQAGTPGLDARLRKAFAGLPPGLWRSFVDGSEIADALPK